MTDAGLFILDAKQDDAAVAERLRGKPSRSDPPKPYGPTKQNQGRALRLEPAGGEVLVCVGEEPLPSAGECADVCFATMCLSRKAGVVRLDGTWAPDYKPFAQKGYEP